MVIAVVGCALMPEYMTIYPGLPTRVVVEPEVVREVGMVTVAGRRFSPAVQRFVRLVRRHDWNA